MSSNDKTSGIADLAPFVAAVLKDRSVHDLVEENKKLKENREKQLLLQVSVTRRTDDMVPDIRLGRDTSMRNAYVVKDEEDAFYLCVDFPAIRLNGNPMKFEIEICLGGVTVYNSCWMGTVPIFDEEIRHTLVKRFIWYAGTDPTKEDEGRFSTCYCDLVAVLFKIESLDGLMESLGLNEFDGDNVRDLKSCSWFRSDSDERLLDYFVNRLQRLLQHQQHQQEEMDRQNRNS